MGGGVNTYKQLFLFADECTHHEKLFMCYWSLLLLLLFFGSGPSDMCNITAL